MATTWDKIARTCDNEVSRADSSRADRIQAMERPGANVDKESKEHDEFLARKLVFEGIARICRTMAAEMIPEQIAVTRLNPNLADPDILDRDSFHSHWTAAYDYALDQCAIRQDVPGAM